MSKIKEELLGYDYEPSDWIEPQAHVMVDELIEYQVYCMTLSELTQRVTKQFRDEWDAYQLGVDNNFRHFLSNPRRRVRSIQSMSNQHQVVRD